MSKKTQDPRMKTFVKGLDEVLNGGIPRKNIVLLAGSPGTMKSSLGFYILYHNAMANDLKGLYVSLEEGRETLLNGMKNLGMDPEKVSDKVTVQDISLIRSHLKDLDGRGWMDVFKMYLRNLKMNQGYHFLVIDSMAVLELMADMENPRKELFEFFTWLRNLDVTTFLIHELPANDLQFSDAGEGFLTDGILHLELRREANNVDLYLSVIKMRKTNHSRDYYPLLYADGFELIRG